MIFFFCIQMRIARFLTKFSAMLDNFDHITNSIENAYILFQNSIPQIEKNKDQRKGIRHLYIIP